MALLKSVVLSAMFMVLGCAAPAYSDADTTSIPLEMKTGRPIVEVYAGHSQIPLKLFLDTGTERTIIFQSAINKLGIPDASITSDASTASPLSDRIQVKKLASLEISYSPDETVSTTVTPYFFDDIEASAELAVAMQHADGLLGADALEDLAYRLSARPVPEMQIANARSDATNHCSAPPRWSTAIVRPAVST